jgi:hypothetical protein
MIEMREIIKHYIEVQTESVVEDIIADTLNMVIQIKLKDKLVDQGEINRHLHIAAQYFPAGWVYTFK